MRASPLQFRRLCRYLRATHPLALPVVIRRVPAAARGPAVLGSHRITGGRRGAFHRITVAGHLDRIAAMFVLFHEWAHASDAEMRLTEGLPTDEAHPDSFWGAYAGICKVWTDTQEARCP